MLYSSVSNNKIKDLKKLNSKKYRDLNSLFLVDGEHLVMEAYNAGYLEELILLDGTDFSLDVKTSYVTLDVMKYISTLDTPNGIMGVCKKKDHVLSGDRVVILDDVQDPGNLGTIIRSSLAFGVDTIVLSKDSVDLYNDKVIRSTQGMIFHINIIRCDLEDVINKIKGDIKIIGTSLGDSTPLRSIDKLERYALIVGNEGNGVKKEILDLCDDIVRIEMNKDVESLNVGVATSIILYEMSDNYE